MILAIKTDQPVAEIYLLVKTGKIFAKKIWKADRKLSNQLLSSIVNLLKKQSIDFKNLSGVIVYQGPGSFTGLRIGVATANGLAYSLGVPIVGTKRDGWIDQGVAKLVSAKTGRYVVPRYGSPPRITPPRA